MFPTEIGSKAWLLAALLPGLAWAALSEEDLFFKGTAEVNDGDLRFLSQAPSAPVHLHQNQITVSADSLATGWVKLEQCHFHLDPVPDMQIVYGLGRVRNLAVASSNSIGRAWVHENSVQLSQVGHDAQLCITAETRALHSDGDNRYSLSNGPYMRRFLDGYYPMRVSMRVIMAAPGLNFLDITPTPQTGFLVNQKANEMGYEASFEGTLRTTIRFSVTP